MNVAASANIWITPGCVRRPSGYGVRVGDWKGVVNHCTQNQEPSDEDVFEIYKYPGVGEGSDMAIVVGVLRDTSHKHKPWRRDGPSRASHLHTRQGVFYIAGVWQEIRMG